MKRKKLLDTSSIYRSDLDFSRGSYVVTNKVLQEITDEVTKSVINSALRHGRIEIAEACKGSVDYIRGEARKSGDLRRLSDTDIELLAVAYELDYEIVTDDYSIQNMCRHIKLPYERGLQEGIKRKLRWSMVCEGCGKSYDYDTALSECVICGSALRKKAD